MRQNKIEKKKKSNLFPACCVLESCLCFSSLILSPVIFEGFLNCNKIDTVPSAAFGNPVVPPISSQKFSDRCLCFSLFSPVVHFTFPPHTQHLKLFVPSLEQRSEPLFNKDMPDAAKAGNLFPFFLRISVFSPHALQAFPHRCPGSFYLIKMHMQQREISKVSRSYMV